MMPPHVIARIVPPDDRAGPGVPADDRPGIVRAFALTPYDLEVLASELHRCGRGARLEVAVDGDDATLAEVTAALAPVVTSGVALVVGLAAPRADGLLRFLDDVARGRVPARARPDANVRADPPGGDDANGAARVRPWPETREAPRAPGARRARGVRRAHDRPTWKEDADVSSTPFGR